jgi:hypothetical protein
MTSKLEEQEIQLNQFIASGQKEEAVRLLYQMAASCALNNDFERADAFRDQLYEVDSMALTAIVKINEIIEAEKTKALTPDRRRIWARFFDGLSTEEANAFFFALKEMTVPADETVLQQGMTSDRLFLVYQGQLKIVHEGEHKQTLIHHLGPGDTFGEDTFFSINICTVSICTLGAATLSYLERDKLDAIRLQFPQLEGHLKKICGSGRKIYDWLRQKGLDRRAYKRINYHTKVSFQVLSSADAALQRPVTAELWDISKYGLSFYFQSKNRQAVRRLVGRTLGVRFTLPVGDQGKEIALTGTVQGVQDHPLDEYSVHLKLRRNFSDEAMKMIRGIAGQ